ncbi:DUF5994 family protein [Mycobacterium parmense]|uniref:DUF5994 family protein n=1 Tax=Mycobacterium parmense TaxID=185642 RepID=UPI000A15EF1C|nr:DUF5994 family protein [Mycobacterium parmense]ORW53569.1 hypothetical protein AWC20_19905 [Mycobacterium parmense]
MNNESRVQLKPYRSVSEHIDGAWWPRSYDLIGELPGLLASVAERLGRVVIVGYRRNGWQETPPLAEIGGHTVELLGFTSDESATVILIGEHGHHLTLEVVRPDTSEDAARDALKRAAVPADTEPAPAGRTTIARTVADVADKLARHEGLGDEERTAQIRQWAQEAHRQFADAPLQTFVPILVEHIVRNRMLETRPRQHRGPPAEESRTAEQSQTG